MIHFRFPTSLTFPHLIYPLVPNLTQNVLKFLNTAVLFQFSTIFYVIPSFSPSTLLFWSSSIQPCVFLHFKNRSVLFSLSLPHKMHHLFSTPLSLPSFPYFVIMYVNIHLITEAPVDSREVPTLRKNNLL